MGEEFFLGLAGLLLGDSIDMLESELSTARFADRCDSARAPAAGLAGSSLEAEVAESDATRLPELDLDDDVSTLMVSFLSLIMPLLRILSGVEGREKWSEENEAWSARRSEPLIEGSSLQFASSASSAPVLEPK